MTQSSRATSRVSAVVLCLLPALALAGRDSWTSVGPVGGEITCIAFAPSNSKTVYAGTGTGRVFRSIDGGQSWSLASGGIAEHSPYLIFSIAVDAKDPLTAYAAADIVLKTVDGGVHWMALPGIPANPDNSDVVVADTTRSGIVYVAAADAGLFKSVDGGSSWTLLGSEGASVSRVAVSRSNPAVLYAFASSPTVPLSIFRSEDAGTHWTKTSPSDFFGGTIVVDPADPDVVFADRERSRDGGKTWSANSNDVVAVAFSADGTVVYGTNFGPTLYESSDGGSTWNVLATGPPNDVIESLATSDSSLLAGWEEAGIFRSVDGGRSWRGSNPGLTAVPISTFSISQADSQRLWLGTTQSREGTGLVRTETSADGGRHWSMSRDGDLDVFAIATDANEPGAAFAEVFPVQTADNPYAYVTVFRSTSDAGASWIDVATGVCYTTTLLTADPRQSAVLYEISYACHNPIGGLELFKTTDRGVSWSLLASETGTMAIDPTNTNRLYRSDYANAGGMFRSDDGGQDWIRTASIDDSSLTQIAVGSDSHSAVLVAGMKGIWRSANMGASWALVDGVPPASSGKILIAADFASPGIFFASVEDRFYVSWDAGQTWQPFTQSGFPDEPVLQLAIARDGELFARTQAGIFELRRVVVDPTTPAGGMVKVGHR